MDSDDSSDNGNCCFIYKKWHTYTLLRVEVCLFAFK